MQIQEQVVSLAARKSVQLVVTAGVSFALGAAISREITKKHYKAYYDELASAEIAEARNHYRVLTDISDYSKTPDEIHREKYGKTAEEEEELAAVVDKLQYDTTSDDAPAAKDEPEDERLSPVVPMDSSEERKPKVDYSGLSTRRVVEAEPEATHDEDPVPVEKTVVEQATRVVSNVFHHQQPRDDMDWDFEEQLELRELHPDQPYIITHEEFLANENDWDQMCLTYFEGDDILADTGDEVISDTEGVVGNRNLLSFGVASRDPNIVYVRNQRIEAEYEIALSKDSYARAVLNFMEHDDQRGISKFRSHDD